MTPPDPFTYSSEPHVRKHAPAGYKNYRDFKPWLRDEFEFRCVYWLQREMWSRARHAAFSVDHVIPQASDPTLICVYGNLVYACLRCNSFKQDIPILDPTQAGLGQHLRIEPDGTVVGLTEDGRFVLELLHLNDGPAVSERRRILRMLRFRQKYPDDSDIEADFLATFSYPEDLPDLCTLEPPQGNEWETNKFRCFHARRQRGELPLVY